MTTGAVLIVHSDREARSLLQSLLVSLAPVGFKTFTVAKDALNHLKTLPLDSVPAIIFDWHLAEIQGAAFLEKAKELVPNFIPVAVSNVMSEEDAFFMTELGIWYVIKTSDPGKKVQAILKKVLDRQKSPEENLGLVSDFQRALSNESPDECAQLLQENSNLAGLLSGSPSTIHMLAEFYLLNRDHTKAIELLKSFLDQEKKDKNPEVLRVLSTMGRALCQAGMFDDALVIFEKLADKSPKNLKHTVSKGDVLLEAGRTTEAQEQYQSALAIDPERTDALNGMAKVYLVQGEDPNEEPLSALLGKVKENYSLASFFNNHGVALARAGRLSEAIAHYQRAMNFLEKYRPLVLFNLGLAYKKSGNIDAANQCFQDVVLSPHGMTLLQRKQALSDFQTITG